MAFMSFPGAQSFAGSVIICQRQSSTTGVEKLGERETWFIKRKLIQIGQ
jgi:hypothetical protein